MHLKLSLTQLSLSTIALTLSSGAIAQALPVASPLGLPGRVRSSATPCGLVNWRGGNVDLTRICGETAQTPPPVSITGTGRPAPLPALPNYGVIFLDTMPPLPVAPQVIQGRVGNASPRRVRQVKVIYEIVNPGYQEEKEGAIAQGEKLVDLSTLQPGQWSTFSLTTDDVLEALPATVPASLRRQVSLMAVRVTHVEWLSESEVLGASGTASVRYANGMGRCYYPWESEGRCAGLAVSERLAGRGLLP